MMTTPDALLRFVGASGAGDMLKPLSLADLCLGRQIVESRQSHVSDPAPLDAGYLADELSLHIAKVQELAAGLCGSMMPASLVIDAVADTVEAVLVAVMGEAVDADRLGLRQRVGEELAQLGDRLGDGSLHVSPVDASLLAPGWLGPPALYPDPSLARGSFQFRVGDQHIVGTIADRLAVCLHQLRQP